MIRFGPEICGNPDEACRREWLETNGIGGFASSTIACINTRRYHGLLTGALAEPRGRFVLLSKLEATLAADGADYPLCANVYPGVLHPAGFERLREFRLDPFPVFTYGAAGRTIEKRVVMAQGENTVIIEYALILGAPCDLRIRPLVAFRGYHETTHRNSALSPAVTRESGGVSIHPYATLPRLFITFTEGEFVADADWYYNFLYPRERERGLDYLEDLYSPFALRFQLRLDAPVRIAASTLPDRKAAETEAVFDVERKRRGEPGEAFLIHRPTGAPTVIAGYHWFTDWGRDTMISLPGLALATKRFDRAREILLAWTRLLDRGMLPNRFPDGGIEPEYNTVDAALWLFEAVRKYVEYTGDLDTVRDSLYKPLLSVLDWYARGARFGIRADADGLIVAGGEGAQLTWMDAMVRGRPATPRHGKPVEIQALWYNALRFTEWLAREFSDPDLADGLAARAAHVKQSFATRFRNRSARCLFDAIDQPGDNAMIRPNQVIALSLGFPLVAGEAAIEILEVIERDLLTPFGLRTLAPSDPQYRGKYEGGVEQRDSAYHQGTVWPWLLGHFITAYVRARGRNSETTKRVAQWLSAFDAHLSDAGLGFISEIFDGDEPHQPRGCIAQAWSVAEIVRARVEELSDFAPVRRIGIA